jgi:hypothetical protein
MQRIYKMKILPSKPWTLNLGFWHWVFHVIGNHHGFESTLDLHDLSMLAQALIAQITEHQVTSLTVIPRYSSSFMPFSSSFSVILFSLVGTLLPDLRENNVKRDGGVAPDKSSEAPDDADVGVLTLSDKAGEDSGFLALKLNNLEVLTLMPGEGLGSAGGVVDGTMDADPSDKLERLLPGLVDI